VKGKLIIFSAPSGSGKTTIVRHLLKKFPSLLAFSVSASTREKREHEIEGKDYYFLPKKEFRDRIANDEFAEWEEVYAGNYYGTFKSEIQRLWDEGKAVLFDVDVKGGLKLKEIYRENALAIFVKVSSEEEIIRRLSGRGTETEKTLEIRLGKVHYELSFESKFDVTLVNDDLELTLAKSEEMVLDFIGKN
jgi:guanylate kinase